MSLPYLESGDVHRAKLTTVCVAIDGAISHFLESHTKDEDLCLHWAQLVELLRDSHALAPACVRRSR